MNFKEINFRDMNLYAQIAFILVLIGGFNWGLIGLFNINIITGIFGMILGRIIFIILGIATGYLCYVTYFEKPN